MQNDWLEQVEKDITPKKINELNHIIAEHIQYPAIAFFDYKKHPYIGLNKNSADWNITHEVSVNNINTSNKIALEALKHGADSLIFQINKSLEENEIKSLLSGIELGWIETNFIFSNNLSIDDISTFKNHIKKIFPESSKATINYYSKNTNQHTSYFEFEYLNDDEKNYEIWAKTILSIFEQKAIQKIFINFKGRSSSIWNIVQLRSLRLIIDRLCEIEAIDELDFDIHFSVDKEYINSNPHQNMIGLTNIGMSGILGGADSISLAIDHEHESDNIWILSNIHLQYILKEEAKLNKVIDPVKGSHGIESMTDELCIKLWNYIQLISGQK